MMLRTGLIGKINIFYLKHPLPMLYMQCQQVKEFLPRIARMNTNILTEIRIYIRYNSWSLPS